MSKKTTNFLGLGQYFVQMPLAHVHKCRINNWQYKTKMVQAVTNSPVVEEFNLEKINYMLI